METKSIKTYSRDELADLLGPADMVGSSYSVISFRPLAPKSIKTYGKDQVAEMLGPAEMQYLPGVGYTNARAGRDAVSAG